MKKINTDTINEYISKLEESGYDYSSITSKLKTINKYLNLSSRQGKLSKKTYQLVETLITNRIKDFTDKIGKKARIEENNPYQPSTQIGHDIPSISQFNTATYHGEKTTDGITGQVNVSFHLETYRIKSFIKGILRYVPLIGNKLNGNNAHSPSLTSRQYIAFGIIMLVMAFLASGTYFRFNKPKQPLAYPTSLTVGTRTLSFQGRLTDSLGNPITTATNLVFKLHTASSGGSQLYTSGTCSITPDQDGIFSSIIGSDCGSEIASTVFSENQNVYLGITVGSDSEMTPRQQIANVGYAINSETLQGFPPGTSANNIPYIDNQGDIRIAASSPSIVSNYASQTFIVGSAQALTLQTAGAGDITLTATETGTIKFLTGGTQAGVVTNGQLWGLGTTGPDAKLDSLSTAGEQLRLTYTDGSVHTGFTTSSGGDLTIDATGGQIYLADTDTINIGGVTGLAYSAFANSSEAPEEAAISSDNDLYIGGDVEIDGTLYAASVTATSLPWSGLTDPSADITLAMTTYNSTFNWDPGADTTETSLTLTTQGEDSSTDEDQVLLALSQTSNGTDVTEAADALLTFVNNDSNDPVDDAIRFDAGAAGVDFNNGIDFSGANLNREIVLENGEAIHGQSADTIVFEDDDGTDYATLTGTALTITGDLAISGGNITSALTADSTLTVTGTTTTNGTLTANGVVTLGDNGDTVAINSSDWDINTTGDASGIGALTMDGNFTQSGATTFSSGTGTFTVNGGATFNTDVDMVFTGTENLNISSDLAGSVTMANIVGTPSDSSGTAYGLYIDQANHASNTNGFDASLVIDNSDSDLAITDGIVFTSAGGAITDAIDASDSNIGTALRVDANDIVGTTGLINYTNFDVDASGNITISGDIAVNGGDITTTQSTLNIDVANGGTIQFRDGSNTLNAVKDQGVYSFFNFSGKSDTGDPATCAEGDVYYNDTDDTIKICHESNVWEGLDGGGSSLWSGLLDPTADLTLAMADYDTTFTWNTPSTSTTKDAISLEWTNDASTDSTTQRLLVLNNNDDGGSTGTTERFMVLDNKDANEAVTTGIEILASSTGTITTAIDISDDEIGTALSIGTNDVSATNWNVAGSTGIISSTYYVDITNSGYGIDPAGTSQFGGYSLKVTGGSLLAADTGSVGIGDQTPDAKLNIQATTEQMRLDYDDSNYSSFTVGSGGDLTIAPSGGDTNITGNLATSNNTTLGDGSGDAVTSNAGAWTFANATTVDLANSQTSALAFESDLLVLDTSNDGIDITSGASTADTLDFTFDSLTTAKGIDMSIDGLSTGTGLYMQSTSTALGVATLGGSLISLDWTPGSATTAATDLFRLNIGPNGNVTNLLNITDNSSSLFRVAENQIESAIPHSFTAPGDVSVAYDLLFSNQTASYIKSNAPLTIEAGETWESNDLTLKTYNSGDLVFDLAGGVTFAQAQAWDLANSSTSSLNIESGLLNFDTTNSRVGINDTTPDAKLDLDSSSTSGGDFLITNTGVATSGTIAGITANSVTTGDILTLSATGLTTGSMLLAIGPSSTGVTDHFVQLTSDIGSAKSLLNLNPDFSGSGVTAYGVYNLATDATANANTDYGYYGSLALTGNAAKNGYGIFSTVSSSSTTADTLAAFDASTSTTGIITTGTRNVYGLRSQPSSTGASTGGTTNVYGAYLKSGGVVGAGGTINSYGAYIANGTMNTTGTSNNYGLYVETPSGADNNYAAVFAGGNVGIGTTAPAFRLHVSDSQSATGSAMIENTSTDADADGLAIKLGFTGTGTSTNYYTTFLNGLGNIQGKIQSNGSNGIAYTTTGTDFAEYFPITKMKSYSRTDMSVATLVCQYQDGGVGPCDNNSGHILGVISDRAGFIGGIDRENNPQYALVGLVGQLSLKISDENGAVKNGDPLTVSKVRGKAAKATRAGRIIGFAQSQPQSHVNGDKTVFTTIQPTYFDPDIYITDNGDMKISETDSDKTINQSIVYDGVISEQETKNIIAQLDGFNLHDQYGKIIDRMGKFSKIITAKIEAGLITGKSLIIRGSIVGSNIIAQMITTVDLTTKNLVTDKLSASSADIDQIRVDTFEAKQTNTDQLIAKEASVSGTIKAKLVESENITEQEQNLSSLRERLKKVSDENEIKQSELSDQVNYIQQTLSDIDNQSLPDVAYYQNIDEKTLGSLTVSNDANIYDLYVTHIASLGNLMIQDNAVSSSMAELKLTALESINLLDGAVIIAKNGTITTKGALIALGGVKTDDIKSTKKSDVAVTLEKNDNPSKVNQFQVKDNDGQVVSSINEKGQAQFKDISLESVDTATASGTIIAASQNIKINGVNAPAVETNAAASGTAILPAGAIDLIVYNEKIGPNSLVYITPTTPTQNNNLYIAYKQPCASVAESTCKPFFKVSIDNKINSDVKFNWLLINND